MPKLWKQAPRVSSTKSLCLTPLLLLASRIFARSRDVPYAYPTRACRVRQPTSPRAGCTGHASTPSSSAAGSVAPQSIPRLLTSQFPLLLCLEMWLPKTHGLPIFHQPTSQARATTNVVIPRHARRALPPRESGPCLRPYLFWVQISDSFHTLLYVPLFSFRRKLPAPYVSFPSFSLP